MSDDVNKTKDNHDGYEDICYICRRPESKVGKMVKLLGDITVCSDCMQKTLDSMHSGNGFGNLDFMNFSPFIIVNFKIQVLQS